MSQEKAAEIIDLNASRDATALSRFERAGEFLANARRAAGLSLEAISADIKVKAEHLDAIEKTRADKLPAAPYAIGFVKVYAQYLDLDAAAVAAQFKADIGAVAPAAIKLAPNTSEIAPDVGEGVRIASIFGIIAILLFAVWVGFEVTRDKDTGGNGKRATAEPRITLSQTPAPMPAPRPDAATPVAEDALVDTVAQTEPQTPVISDSASEQNIETARAVSAETAPQHLAGPGEAGATPEPLNIHIEAPAAMPPPAALAIEETPEAVNALAEERQSLERPPAQEVPPAIAPGEVAAPVYEPVIIDSELTRSVAPTYPDRCGRSAAPMESVTILFDITGAGRVANARVVSATNPCFEDAALRAIGRWRFSPKTVDGAAQADAGKTATLNFRQ